MQKGTFPRPFWVSEGSAHTLGRVQSEYMASTNLGRDVNFVKFSFISFQDPLYTPNKNKQTRLTMATDTKQLSFFLT